MSKISRRLRELVIQRAKNLCEYCGLSQEGQEAAFHVDHIIPVVDGGPTTEENLAFACVSCSLRKEARRIGIDPETGQRVPLFHPRRDSWQEHFSWNGLFLVGLTARGRATIVT